MMNITPRRERHHRAKTALAVASLLLYFGSANITAAVSVANVPLFLTSSVPPLVMLSLSNDTQLYFEAYPDYADLTGDGAAEQTYNHAVDYYGYFDNHKCYTYTGARFQPQSITADKYCGGGQWSGNFLNYVSMARIDVIRKILYGGYRSTDTASQTVLERTYLPNDAHSWVRYYDGADIADLTPFSLPATSLSTSTTSRIVPAGSLTATSARHTFTTTWNLNSQVQVGDQIEISSRGSPNTIWMRGVVISFNTGTREVQVQVTSSAGVGTTRSDWDIVNASRRGISFCNTTVAPNGTFSQNVTAPPLIRVASGNYSLWTANERYQCRWSNEVTRSGHAQMTIGPHRFSNGNDVSATRIPANADNPVRGEVALGEEDYFARVEACVPGLEHNETCALYPDGNKKPVGLLQIYGEDADKPLHFGLMTGSYMRNKSGGVLRRNIGDITNEINVNTNGTFAATPVDGAIIGTLNRFRLYGYRHGPGNGGDGTYNSSVAGGDNCIWGLNSFNDGRCTNWGNPQSEVFLESLRYFAGKTPSTVFEVSGTDRLPGLPALTSWNDPLSNDNWCAALSVISFNSSVPSYDSDQLAGVTDLGAASATALTDLVGVGEGIHGNSWFVGTSGAATDQLCTPKAVSSLGSVTGTCPDAPRLGGTYHVAGLAHHAHTTGLRNDLVDGDGNPVDIYAKTYGVSLAPAVPRIEIPRPGQTNPAVTILPACRNASVGGNCSIVDFKIVEQNIATGTGTFLVQWEDSEQGGDYDMDKNGLIEYTITNSSITVKTNVFSQSTPYQMGFGYVISGTTQDGFHVHSGINGFTRASPTPGVPGCANCVYNNLPTSHTFTLGASATGSLEDPLYYAAKWGGYDKVLDAERTAGGLTGFPDYVPTWDSDGSGLPDNYFFAIDPLKLFEGLKAALDDILWRAEASGTAAATSSAVLQTDTLLYTAKFRSTDWSGTVEAREVDPVDGTPGAVLWDAEQKLYSLPPGSRNIFTLRDDGAKIPLLWSDLGTAQQTALAVNPSATPTAATGEDRLAWLRGTEHPDLRDRVGGGIIRRIGDLVNSDPQFMFKRDFGYSLFAGTEGNAYKTFRGSTSYRGRPDVLFVASNGGMLHAFHAGTPFIEDPPSSGLMVMDPAGGVELFSYVPSELLLPGTSGTHSQINELMEPGYDHRYFVDGTAAVGDAYLGAWKSVLVGTMGAGGRTVFALDVTDPSAFDASKVMWEFGYADADCLPGVTACREVGYGITQPTITRLSNGSWVAIFGNGYNSASDKAQLFVVNLANGQLVAAVDTGVGTTGTPNGLGPAVATDWPSGDLNAARAYAADLQGNLWRFNLAASPPTVGKLFSATDTLNVSQPITARPSIAARPGSNGQIVVAFGTGSFFRTGDDDMTSPQVQSMYGVFDSAAGVVNTTRSQLTTQVITTNGSAVTVGTETYSPGTLRFVSSNTVGNFGWVLHLPVAGERVISEATFPSGTPQQRVRFTTLIPDPDLCGSGRDGFLMDFALATGGTPGASVFDLSGDGVVDDAGDLISGQVAIGIGGTTGERITVIRNAEAPLDYLYAGDGTKVIDGLNEAGPVGRQSWRQLR